MLISIKSFAGRIYLLVIGFLIILSTYYIFISYHSVLEIKEKDNLERLMGITATISELIEPKEFETLLKEYPNKDDIIKNKDDSIYLKIHRILKNFEKNNQLGTPIYILIKDPKQDYFFFGVTSADNPYYRHVYNTHPDILMENYSKGGVIPIYEDKHGTWLSAFTPLKLKNGKVLGVVQADIVFENFTKEAQKILFSDIIIFLLALLGLSIVLISLLSKILKNEAHSKKMVEQAIRIVKDKNQKITKSIRYAKSIQDAMFKMNESSLHKFFDSFRIDMPKNIVSGDFIWTHEIKSQNKIYVAVVDCTGHGVPGALLSILGASLLYEIIVSKLIQEPNEILITMDKKIKSLLNQGEKNSLNSDGMDIGLCLVDYTTMTLAYAGAHHQIISAGQEGFKIIRGDRAGLGGSRIIKPKLFTNWTSKFYSGDKIYLYSDGIVDQFGINEEGKKEKFKRRRLTNLIKDIYIKPMADQKKNIETVLNDWRNGEPQTDDISLLAVQL